MNKDIRLFVELRDQTVYEVSNVFVDKEAESEDITVIVRGKPYPLNRQDIKRFFTEVSPIKRVFTCINSTD
jgi:hypothetical protein